MTKQKRLQTQLKITIERYDTLPRLQPWTLETLSEYSEELVKFIIEYGDIARFNTKDVFLDELPVDWVPEPDLETWVAIVSGKYTERWS